MAKKAMGDLFKIFLIGLTGLAEEIKHVASLRLDVSEDTLSILCGGNTIRSLYKERETVNYDHLEYAKTAVFGARNKLRDLQMRYLVSFQLQITVKDRVGALSPNVWNKFKNELIPLRTRWEEIRESKEPSLPQLRSAYLALDSKIRSAKQFQINENIRVITNSAASHDMGMMGNLLTKLHNDIVRKGSRPSGKNKKRSEYDRNLRQSMKGVNPPADKHGHSKRKQHAA